MDRSLCFGLPRTTRYYILTSEALRARGPLITGFLTGDGDSAARSSTAPSPKFHIDPFEGTLRPRRQGNSSGRSRPGSQFTFTASRRRVGSERCTPYTS